MITNFQIKQRNCKYHSKLQQFICMNKQCQYRALLCFECTRENHSTHLYDIRSIQSFIQTFKQKVRFYQTQFQKDKVIINVKQIIKTKISELDQVLNQIMISVIKMLEREKNQLCQQLKIIQDKYEQVELEYKKNLDHRYDCLQYLSAYKTCPQALEARILCSSQWGIVSLKNSLLDIKNLSSNQERNVTHLTSIIINECQNLLKQDSLINSLKKIIQDYYGSNQSKLNKRSSRITSFIEKSFIGTTNNTTMLNTPKSSRVINQRPRTLSLGGINQGLSRMTSNPNIQARKPSLEQISKIPSESNLLENRYLKGLKKLQLSKAMAK